MVIIQGSKATDFQKAMEQKRKVEQKLNFDIKSLAVNVAGKFNETSIASSPSGKFDDFKADVKKVIAYFDNIKDTRVKQLKMNALELSFGLSDDVDSCLKTADKMFLFLKDIGLYVA